jgi:hypothetical protein
MNEKFLSGCAGKTPYLSKADALAVIRHRERTGRMKGRGRGRCDAYPCRHCKRWHIGSGSGVA